MTERRSSQRVNRCPFGCKGPRTRLKVTQRAQDRADGLPPFPPLSLATSLILSEVAPFANTASIIRFLSLFDGVRPFINRLFQKVFSSQNVTVMITSVLSSFLPFGEDRIEVNT